MNVLIAAEKPSLSHSLARTAREYWPTASITFVHIIPYGNLSFNYPRGLKFSNFPCLSQPQFSLQEWDEWYGCPLDMDENGKLTVVDMCEELFTKADLIVYACDPDHTGAFGFEATMQKVFGDDRHLACPALNLRALDEHSIKKSFEQIQPFGDTFEHQLSFGRLKRYFDWNWNLNSLAILGETQRLAGLPAEAPPMSKYALQLLYGLRSQPPMTDGQVFSLMQKWPGTGRYKGLKRGYRVRLGSLVSARPIVENMLKAGLLSTSQVNGKQRLAVSMWGHELLARLHPDCEDADLPFRLEAWCMQGPAAKPAIDRYIKTFFGKQKRFLATLAK